MVLTSLTFVLAGSLPAQTTPSAPANGNLTAVPDASTSSPASGNATPPPVTTNGTTVLPDIVVTGREDDLVGTADSATQGTVGAKEIADRPVMRNGEMLETIPGVIITQHAGGGKANQYFLRGFNLDHGTDLAIDIDGMPLNLPTHAHGQGYSDMNIVIPELVQGITYEKGPYYAANGDFSSAGAAHITFFKSLPEDLVSLSVGMYGYGRAMFASSTAIGSGNLLYGGELYHDDGPWTHPDDYQRVNGIATYSQGDNDLGYSLTARAYHGTWNSSDQVATSAVDSGQIPFFGSLDPSDGGNSQRYSVQGEWHREDANSSTKVNAYAFYYDLDLFSDFTYFLTDDIHGDQFEQKEHREVAGLNASHTIYGKLFGREMENTFGLQVRNDWISDGLFQTEDRNEINKIDTNPADPNFGQVIPATIKQDAITQTSAGLYYENKVQWGEKVRTVLGLRYDLFNFDVHDEDPANSGDKLESLPSPKGTIIFGPWDKTEFYLQGGLDYHSSDARAVTQTTNPDASPIGGTVNGLVPTKGAEVGVRSSAIPHLQSTASLWYLHSNFDSEQLFDNDSGIATTDGQPSERYGVELANYYTPTDWLTLDCDWGDSWAYFDRPDGDGGKMVPEAIRQVVSAGITVHDPSGWSSSLRLRYFGPRALISTGAAYSSSTSLLDWQVRYKLNEHCEFTADVFNLLDRRDHDIDYYYQSQTSPGAAPQTEVHFHPVEPFQMRFGVNFRY